MPTAIVIIAIGSSYQQAAHIRWASQRLSHLLQDVQFSRMLWTADIRGTGQYYINRLIKGRTALAVSQLETTLKKLEKETCRTQNLVTADLDILQYNDERYHERDWQRSYIQLLLPDML